MKSILSTKKLSVSQRELLLNSGISFLEYNAIDIEFIDFEAPAEIENAIFTSRNAVNSFSRMGGDQIRFKTHSAWVKKRRLFYSILSKM